MMITKMEHLNDGTECEGFGICGNIERVIARYKAEILTDWLTNRRTTVRLCERHVGEHMRMQVNRREHEAPIQVR